MSSNSKALRSLLRCDSFCTASSYDLLGIASFFKKKGYLTHLSKDYLHVTNSKRQGDIFFFNYGCFVCWGYKKSFSDRILESVREFASHPLSSIETDHFYYRYGEMLSFDTHERLRVDIMTLDTDDSQVKLAMSYGISQSSKLSAFEETIKAAIAKNDALPLEIAANGSITLSRRSIFKRIGEIFIVRSSVNINIEYLDVPEFFWRNPNLEPYYIVAKKFLDIQSRVMALNQKLDVLQELLHILNSQVQHSHSSLLESIIILLIAFEIIISLFQLHVV